MHNFIPHLQRNLPLLNSTVDFLDKKNTPSSFKVVENEGEKKNLKHLGWFHLPFNEINIQEALPTPFLSPFSLLHSLRLKKWQFFSFSSPDFIVGLAIVHTGYLSNFFIYAFDFKTKKFQQFEHLAPFLSKAKVAPNSVTGTSIYKAKDHYVVIENHLDSGHHLINFHSKNSQGEFIKGEIKVWAEGEPLVNNREVAPHRIVYTHQNSMYRPEGKIQWNGANIVFQKDKHFSTMDYTMGFHRYITNWNWAAAGGFAEDGTPVAINIASDITYGTNDVVVFWIGPRIHRLPKAKFTYQNTDHHWEIKANSPQGKIDLSFKPVGKREGNINLGILLARFQQPFGHFSGKIVSSEGKTYHLKNIVGVTEEHFAKW